VIKLTIWIIRGLIVIIGPLLGYFQISKDIKGIFLGFIGALVVVIIEYIIEKIPLDTLIAAGIGVVLGYIFEQLFEYGLFSAGKENLNEIVTKYSFLIKFMFIILGLLIAVRKKEEADLLDKDIFKSRVGKFHQQPKIVDTSVIIDGRIADICETKFMSGIIIIPKFILLSPRRPLIFLFDKKLLIDQG